jgi:hypothetical protein
MENLKNLFVFVTLNNGKVLKGKVIEHLSTRLYISNEGNEVGFSINSIKSMKACFDNGIVTIK